MGKRNRENLGLLNRRKRHRTKVKEYYYEHKADDIQLNNPNLTKKEQERYREQLQDELRKDRKRRVMVIIISLVLGFCITYYYYGRFFRSMLGI